MRSKTTGFVIDGLPLGRFVYLDVFCESFFNEFLETQVPLLKHSLSVLCFLHRIEPELVDPVSSQVLSRIALVSLEHSFFFLWMN